jgi:FKBP-type peptidyl-prolyl cis-trans isomerase FkpA
MQKSFLFAIISGIFLCGVITGCSRSDNSGDTVPCNAMPVTADSSALLAFAKVNGISPVADSTGLYYQIITPGTGVNITTNSVVYVTYKAMLMNGTIFDSTSTATRGFAVSELIPAWQIGLPKIKAGGHIKLLVPSALGYGCAGSPPAIPANAPLFFDLTVVSAQ